MRVLHLSPASGEATGIASYARALRRAATQFPGLEMVAGEELGTAEIPLRGVGLAGRVRALVERWRKDRALASFDLVHVEIGGASYREYYLARELGRQDPERPRVITLHDPPFTVGRTHLERLPWCQPGVRVLRRAWELTAGWLEERSLLSRARGVIVLSAGGAAALRRRFPGLAVPLSVVEHIEFAETAAAGPSSSTEVGLLWLGYPVKGAGLPTLLGALAAMSGRGSNHLPPWRLRVAGAPAGAPGWEALRAQARRAGLEDRVEFVGFVPEDELPRLLAQSQVLVVPRERRGRGRRELMSVSGSMIRAMSCGLAVVATDARAAAEEVVPGRTGLLVAPGDVRGLAEALQTVITDAGLRARLGREAQLHVRTAHAPRKVLADHYTLYAAAATRGKP